MGACYSCSVSPGGTSSSLQALNSLDTGDVVFLHEKAAAPVYISRASSWTSFTHVGFLVRDGLGADGLAVCHADRRTAGGSSQVVRENLVELLSSGRYQVILVRRLCKRLGPDQRELAQEFVRLNLGKQAPTAASPPATVLMQAHHYTGGCERLHCSEFVATMLHLVGLVEPSPDNPREYTATHPRGYVVQVPQPLRLPLLLPATSSERASPRQPPTPSMQDPQQLGRQRPSSRAEQQAAVAGRSSRQLPSPKALSRETSAELAGGFESDPSSRAGSRGGSRSQSRSQSRCHSRAASGEQELPLPLALEGQLQGGAQQQRRQQRRTLSPRGVVGPARMLGTQSQRAQQQQQQAGDAKESQQPQPWPAVELLVQQALVA
ncbi:hypothetical protein N2152v2_006608 [Parachlorella kessleri]